MVKKAITTKFEAFDGTLFDSEQEATAYENANFLKTFTNKKIEKFEAALAYETDEGRAFADQIEKLGNMIKKIRIDAGFKKKGGRQSAEGGAEEAGEAAEEAVAEAAPEAANDAPAPRRARTARG